MRHYNLKAVNINFTETETDFILAYKEDNDPKNEEIENEKKKKRNKFLTNLKNHNIEYEETEAIEGKLR